MNPLTDELDDETKAVLAVQFAAMESMFLPLDVERQRFINKTWNLPISQRWR